MAKYLVIVESPAKVKTIKKFLGPNYEVAASNGHVRDLPKSRMGIDIENDYEPKYITIRGKGDILANLRKEVKKAEKIYLATDPDREGEAISWHLTKALNLEKTGKKVYRITFNEITKNAVKESLKHPREIDMSLVDAQQARRELDRMVGYRISPLLWAKVKRGLSAGRVQSVALRMICDREDEINAFIPEAVVLPILVFVGISSYSQAFEVVDRKYFPAVIMASLPVVMDFIVDNMREGALPGFMAFDPGSAFVGLLVGCVFVFIIDNNWKNASITNLTALGLTGIGMIHSPGILGTETYAPDMGFVQVYVVLTIAFFVMHVMKFNRKERKTQ